MTHFVLWAIGFAVLMGGLRFDDEVILIVAVLVGIALIVWGLATAPLGLQIPVEIVSILAIFAICMECIERGRR